MRDIKTAATVKAIKAGLLVFAPPGTGFPGRGADSLPFLIDSRGAGTKLELRELVVKGLAAEAAACTPFDVIAGVAKAGTPWGAWLAWAKRLPFANVLLDGPRGSGLQREVEGDVGGRRVALVDNWVRSGASIRQAAEVVKRAGGTPVAVLAIVKTGEPNVGLPVRAIWEIGELLGAARLSQSE